MRPIALTLVLLLSMMWTLEARAETPALVRPEPRLALARPRVGARRELLAGLGLSVAGSGLLVLGGTLMGADEYSPASFTAGFSLSITSAVLFYPTLLTVMYGAGHDHALAVLDGAGVDALDRVEARARRIERAGIGLFAGGLGLMLVGVGMVLGGLQGVNFDSGGGGNQTLFWSGFGVAMAGDATWFAGTLAWTYGGGVHRGVREARRSLQAGLGGLTGTF